MPQITCPPIRRISFGPGATEELTESNAHIVGGASRLDVPDALAMQQPSTPQIASSESALWQKSAGGDAGNFPKIWPRLSSLHVRETN